MSALDLVFILFGAAILFAASFGFILVMSQAQKDRAAKREIALRFYADPQGNYPQDHYLLERGIYLAPGNNSNLANPNYIIQPVKSEVVLALPKEPEALINPKKSTIAISVEAESVTTMDEVTAYLALKKGEGLSMTATLKELGIKGGEPFNKLAAVWKSLS